MKKAYLFIFILTMVFGTSRAFASDTEDYREVMQTLIDFEIIDGEIDDLDASEKLTRGTAAMWIYNAMESENEAEKSSFTDVSAGTQTADAIMELNSKGLVSGYGDGTFRPRNAITYQEYTKILIDFLGYNQAASVTVRKENGYNEMASSLKLNKGVSNRKELSVGEGARILYNALRTEMLVSRKTPLETYKNILWREGRIERNAYTGLSDANGAGAGFIQIDGERYRNDKDEYNNLLGITVTAYYRSEPSGESIVHLTCKKEFSELIVNSEQIFADQSDRQKLVYETDNNGRSKTAKIAASADIIYNEKANPNLETELFCPACGEVRLLDSDSDGVYDIVFITDYKLFFVSHASEASRTIYNQYSGENASIELDEEAVLKIVDADGEALEFSDIQENTVALIAYSQEGDTPYCKVIVSDRFYKGTLQAINDNGITIDGHEAEFSTLFKEAVDRGDIKALQLSNEYTVYLDAFGRVAAYDMSYSGMRYGYLKTAYMEPGRSEVYVKIFDESGEWQTLTVKKNVLVDKIKCKSEDFLRRVAPNNLVRYNMNSNKELTSLDNSVQLSDDDAECVAMIENDVFRSANLNSTSNNNKYYSNNKSFSNEFFMEQGEVIFLIPKGDGVSEDDFRVTDRTYLTSENRYELTVYDVDEYMYSRIFAMYYDTSSVAGLESILNHDDFCMIVDEVLQEYIDGEVVSVAHGWVKGQEWSYTGTDENTFSDVSKGDIIRSKYDDSGKLSKYVMVHRLGSEDVTTNVDDVNNAKYIKGSVQSIDFASLRVRIREGKNRTIVLPETVPVTVYDKQDKKIRTGVLQDINPDDYLVFRMRSSVPQEIFVIKE